MAGINFLYEEYKKDPSKIEKLLNGKIEISEKLDASRFLVQNDEGNRLMYFKRKDVPISKIDRTLSKYYEKAIYHFENLPDSKISQFPEGWRFGLEYFPNLQPVTIVYDRLPLNNLVLTDIQVKDPKDRTIDVISDKATLQKWADILEVESPPIFFEGELSDFQKRRILDFLNTPYSDLVKRFKTENFTSFILGLLSPEMKSSFMHNDTSKDIDGLIFKFDGKETYRVSNPEVTLKKTEKKQEKPSDIYNLTLVLLQEFLVSLDFSKIRVKGKSFEERYIDFIEQVFNRFLKTSTYKVNFEKGVDFELPKFLTREESDVNFNFVKDPETKKALAVSNTNRELFRILMASMRSHKRKPSGFFTKDLIFHHNELVDKIADYIGSNLKESEFYSFKEFKAVYLTESEEWSEEFGKERMDETENVNFVETAPEGVPMEFPTYDQVIKPEAPEPSSKPLEVLKKMYSPETEEEEPKKRTKVCIMVGKFQPFHNGHYSVASDAEKETGMKVFLVINNRRKSNFSEELQRNMLDEIVTKHKSISGYVFSDGRSLREAMRDLPEKYEAGAFAGSEDECEDAKTQMGKDFMTVPLTRHVKSKTVLQKLKEEDQESFKKLMPKELHNFFYKLKNEVDAE
jgi:hypothetical protein